MIILDELISSIDKDSDIKTTELLKNISNNKIIVLITHRGTTKFLYKL